MIVIVTRSVVKAAKIIGNTLPIAYTIYKMWEKMASKQKEVKKYEH